VQAHACQLYLSEEDCDGVWIVTASTVSLQARMSIVCRSTCVPSELLKPAMCMSSLGVAIGKTFGSTIPAPKAPQRSTLSLVTNAEIGADIAAQLMGATTMVGTIKASTRDCHAREGMLAVVNVRVLSGILGCMGSCLMDLFTRVLVKLFEYLPVLLR
jgi:hypothetical protein